MNTRKITCISCPIGCELSVQWEEGQAPVVTGNKCPRGEVYGSEEIMAPKRMVTATVASTSTSFPRVPVRTTHAIAREYIQVLLNELSSIKIDLPVACGNAILKDFQNTGVDIVVTRSLAGN